MTDTSNTQIDSLAAALVRLAEHGVPSDFLWTLVHGNESLGIKPGALAAALAAQPAPKNNVTVDVEAEIARVVQSVNEWDDRTSPDDYPDHLLITSEELSDLLRNFAATLEGAIHA